MNFLSDTCKHKTNEGTCSLLKSKCIKLRFFSSPTCGLQSQIEIPEPPKPKEPIAAVEIKASPDSNMIKAMALMVEVEGMKAANARFYSLGDDVCYREEDFILIAKEIKALLEREQ